MKQHKHSPLHLRQTTLSEYKLFDMIVFSHLRWEFVFQRPQHLISKFAKHWNILFVEEATPTGSLYQPLKNITVFQPKSNGRGIYQEISKFIKRFPDGVHPKVAWFYSASFVDILDQIKPEAIVYDCMDELSAFKGAPSQLKSQERILLKQADIVFTGGKSLYETKKELHDNVFCFPSSVDRGHFKKTLSPFTKTPSDLQHIPKPIAIFYGVLDERFDIELLKKTAWLRPDVSFVIIGPVVKIDQKDMPTSPNIYYLGQRNYKELPAYLKGSDVALIPFALNESTQYISPTKTLEYMAAGLPIISTPIYDVVRDYKHAVSIVSNAEEMSLSLSKYLNEVPIESKQRLQTYQTILDNTSWDKTASVMFDEIKNVLETKQQESKVTVSSKLKYALNPFS